MKLIIDIPYENYYTFKCDLGKENLNALAETVGNGIPYEEKPQGDLISREALRNVILNDSKLDGANANWEVNRILVHINNAPTVDIWQMRQEATENALKKAEVLYARPHGKWSDDEHGYFQVYCSVCKETNRYTTNFCPNCGADMRKPNCVTCDHFGKCEGCEKRDEE